MIQAINLTDGYKIDHRRQMPENIVYQLNNMTPRKTRRENVDKIVWFGLQYFIKRYLIDEYNNTFFSLPKKLAVSRFKRRVDNYLGEGHRVTFKHIEDLYDLGYLPLLIKSVPEGTRMNIGVPPVTIENTLYNFVWLVGYIETVMSCTTWGPSTSATTAFEFRKILNKYSLETVGNTDFVPFQGHDFSFRGMFGVEAAMMSGAAHLLSFVGTDTVPAIDFLEEYYGADSDKELVGCSVAATEHSVMCLTTGFFIYNKFKGNWERIGDAEFEVFKRLVTEIYPDGIISIVSDTFNLWTVLGDFLPKLKEQILTRNGKIVIRPDSGDPVDILTGKDLHDANVINSIESEKDKRIIQEIIENYVEENTPHGEYGPTEETLLFFCNEDGEYYNITLSDISWDRYDKQYYYMAPWSTPKLTFEKVEVTTEHLGVIESLWETFGGTETEKGYKLLDSHVSTIYGDSITTDRAIRICERLKNKGFASINWVAGIGSYSYQFQTRDTDGWAIKATFGIAQMEDGSQIDIDVFKDPITDNGTKKSARGRIQVIENEDGFVLKDRVTKEEFEESVLVPVFKNGVILSYQVLSEIRQRINKYL